MKIQTVHIILVAFIAGLIGYFVGTSQVQFEWKNYNPKVNVINQLPPKNLKDVDFTLFWTVWNKLESKYYDKEAIDRQKLLNGAISGMVAGLEDPYTVFLPPRQNTDFKQGMAGKFEGIGAELATRGNQIVVVKPLYGSPAQKAGIRIGDTILKVENELITGWSLTKTVEKIRGPKGSSIALTILHKDGDKPLEVKIVRDTITVKSVEEWVKKVKDIPSVSGEFKKTYGEREVAYIRLSQFGDNTNQEWIGAVNKISLSLKDNPNVKGLVFDLRDNPGGYLNDAKFIASEFIKDGIVVYQDDGREKKAMNADRPGLLTDIPVVVLINKGSASASEIVAGALRDHKRGKLAGETSFGKGTIQQAEDLGSGAGLHVTIAKWLTPNGTWIHGKGLKPDIEATQDLKDQTRDVQLEKAIEELVK